MKIHTIQAACAALALSAICAPAADTPASSITLPSQPQAAASAEEDEFFLDMNNVSLDFGYMFDTNNGLSVDDLFGFKAGIGYSFKETSTGFHRVGVKAGWFKGTDTVDGQHHSQVIIPLTLSYAYNYKASDRFTLHAGLQAGAYVSQSEAKFGYGNGKMVIGNTSGSVIRHNSKNRHTKIAPTVGVAIGASYKVTKRFLIDAGVSLDSSFNMTKETTDGQTCSKNPVSSTIHFGVIYQY